jgi:hypothetical protein
MTKDNPAVSQPPRVTLAHVLAHELADGTIAVGDRLLVPIGTPTGARSLEIELALEGVAWHVVFAFTSDDTAAAAAQRRDEDDVLDGTNVTYEAESETFLATCDRWQDAAPTVRRMAAALTRLLWGREAGRIGEHLIVALAVDERDRRDPDRDVLAPEDFRAMGQAAARAAMRALAARICERCETPLYGPEDRQSGHCASCRQDRAAIAQIRGGGQ